MSQSSYLSPSPSPIDELRAHLISDGLNVPDQLDTEPARLHARLAAANGVNENEALEWLAYVTGVLPLVLVRPACSSPGEAVFRRLAGGNPPASPWLPYGNMGPVVLMAHYIPSAPLSWGIPACLASQALISYEQYKALHEDVMNRLELSPLPTVSAVGGLTAPPDGAGLLSVLRWMLEHYPLTEEEEEELRACEPKFNTIDSCDASRFGLLPKGWGVAFDYIARQGLNFNADYAPGQKYFPDLLLEKHDVYPVFCGSRRIYLLAADLANYGFEDEWWSSGNEQIEITKVLADRDAIAAAIARNRGRASAKSSIIETSDLTFSDAGTFVDIEVAEMERLNPNSMNTTPEQIVQWVIWRAVTFRASDLHIEKFYNTARFRARIDGELQIIHSCPEEGLPRFIALIKNYSNMGQRRQAAEDGRFTALIGSRRIDCRVSAIPCRRELQKITIRFLDKRDGVKELSELRLSQRQTGIVQSTLGRDQGLILVTGPTGSGKTTTLYAFINSVISDAINIHTVEDPIEYEIEGINQTQTDPINGITFSEGLRRILRADPDVILIGESRDAETASAAVNAALTGHLVLTTLHANDSLRAVSRLISMGVEPYLLADSLAMSQAQRLVRRLCPYCKRPAPLDDEAKRIFERNRIELPDGTVPYHVKVGCPECHDSGYSGRLALMEMCPITVELSDLISRNAPQKEMREIAMREGLLSLYQEGLVQVMQGMTSFEEIACLSYTAE